MLAEFSHWLLATVFDWGYLGIFLLMGMESSVIPIPSELVLIPAGVLIADGKMNLYLVFIVSLLGSFLGSLINYYAAMFVGRRFLHKYGKYFFVSHESLKKMDDFFLNHGHVSTFTGRLIPGARHLISIPAGLAKMEIKLFLIYTGAGAGLWSIILIALGYFIGKSQDLITMYLKEITVGLVLFVLVVIVGYIFFKKKQGEKND
ncbi:MAG: DedA family protein [Thiovulaceae bacterium]|nr:DedA family protein [Sulfurimonadaceae bacterium]